MSVEENLRRDFRECCCGHAGCKSSADAAVAGAYSMLDELERALRPLERRADPQDYDGRMSARAVYAEIARLRGRP